MTEGLRPVDGSYREEGSRVFAGGGRICRALDSRGSRDLESLALTKFFAEALAAGKVVQTWVPPDADALLAALPGQWSAVVEHEPVPVVSYPYEWSFPMLRAAAMLQLELLHVALGEGFICEDATPYNVQWSGVRPVFVDVSSLRPHAQGDPWQGYRQFCQLYLYPLMLEAYRGVAFQPLLRGCLEGLAPEDMSRLFGWGDILRRGVMTHVLLHATLSRAYGGRGGDVRGQLERGGFSVEAIRNNVRGLHAIVRNLSSARMDSEWSGYAECESYGEGGLEAKTAFVEKWTASREWGTVWDVGANRGLFSRIAARHARHVLALDADAAVSGALFDALAKEDVGNVTPLVYRFNDPSPGLGWRGRERSPLVERARPSLVMLLAVVHHLCITANIPVGELMACLRELGGGVIVEFVEREDEKVQLLMRNKRKEHADYCREVFERELSARFRVLARQELPGSPRILYFAEPLS
ncbi:hypothetical protein GGQ74_000815 [Desulfobaculum xiamenense]|uniref:Methyltransferase n=1 Tax=Desulfobaculum xiamenense TaxID=995050 RepID=A0A846QP37_9BACT|nr:methyltransferase [Desulfobaculum xiamenense]NJB67175.1 hypothetical protein [Desulfobaculum xiamenense]